MQEGGCVPIKPKRNYIPSASLPIPALKFKSDHVTLLLKTLQQFPIFSRVKHQGFEWPLRAYPIRHLPDLFPSSSVLLHSSHIIGLLPIHPAPQVQCNIRAFARNALPEMTSPLTSSQFPFTCCLIREALRLPTPVH